jgi:hypothetical protein
VSNFRGGEQQDAQRPPTSSVRRAPAVTPAFGKPAASSGLLAEVDSCFAKWLSEYYDLDVLHAMLAAIAVQHLDGDPVWLLLVGGPGDAKTETVQSAAGANEIAGVKVIVVSDISSVAALLSGTSSKERSEDATGGLLCSVGEQGILGIKDVTTILSMPREARAGVFAALREIYDGKWARSLGTDGGQMLTWAGRITVIGAVTTAWDEHHSAVSSMGDRFVTVRLDSTKNRMEKGLQAFENVGKEDQMREALPAVVRRLVEAITKGAKPQEPTREECVRLLHVANLVTRGRTSVITDHKGEPIDAHMPEAPTRFGKQLLQLFRGACAIGMSREQAMRLAVRCGRDSMPPLRLSILERLSTEQMDEGEAATALAKPRTTIRRQLEVLVLLGLIEQREEDVEVEDADGSTRTQKRKYYALVEGVDPTTLSCPGKSE